MSRAIFFFAILILVIFYFCYHTFERRMGITSSTPGTLQNRVQDDQSGNDPGSQ